MNSLATINLLFIFVFIFSSHDVIEAKPGKQIKVTNYKPIYNVVPVNTNPEVKLKPRKNNVKIVEEYSYHATIEDYSVDGRLTYLCSGAVVSVNHVLTTAKCVAHRDPETIRVRGGSNELEKRGVVYEVKRVLFRKNYNTTRNNIALVRLFKYFHANIIKLKLFQNIDEFDKLDFNSTAMVTAYGKVGDKNDTTIRVAQNTTIFRSFNCKSSYVQSANNISCSGTFYGNITDDCYSYPGGLAVVKKELAGFILYQNCRRALMPGGIYMELWRFFDWVADRTEDPV